MPRKPEIIVSKKLLYKIHRLCQKNVRIEWSGIMFHKELEGDMSDPSGFKLEIVDMLLMDVGTHSFTSYKFDADFVRFMKKNPEYMKMKLSQIHSHNDMPVFFSSTDVDELKINSPNHLYYLSLIVNNAGDMEAKIAVSRKTKSVQTTVIDYKKWEEGKWKDSQRTEVKEFESKEMETFDCNIKVEYDPEFEERMEYIEKVSKKRAEEKLKLERELRFKDSRSIERLPSLSTNSSLHGKNKQMMANFDNDDWDVEEEEENKIIHVQEIWARVSFGKNFKTDFINVDTIKDTLKVLNEGIPVDKNKFVTSLEKDIVDAIGVMKLKGSIGEYIDMLRDELVEYEGDFKFAKRLVEHLDNNVIPKYFTT